MNDHRPNSKPFHYFLIETAVEKQIEESLQHHSHSTVSALLKSSAITELYVEGSVSALILLDFSTECGVMYDVILTTLCEPSFDIKDKASSNVLPHRRNVSQKYMLLGYFLHACVFV